MMKVEMDNFNLKYGMCSVIYNNVGKRIQLYKSDIDILFAFKMEFFSKFDEKLFRVNDEMFVSKEDMIELENKWATKWG